MFSLLRLGHRGRYAARQSNQLQVDDQPFRFGDRFRYPA